MQLLFLIKSIHINKSMRQFSGLREIIYLLSTPGKGPNFFNRYLDFMEMDDVGIKARNTPGDIYNVLPIHLKLIR